MSVVQLASPVDVAAAIGRALTPEEAARADAILDKLSELFRRESGQQFTPGTSTVRVKVNGGRVYLRQRPVTAVDVVTDDAGADVSYTRVGQWLTVPLGSHEFVTVTYQHGGVVPDLVRLTVADAARQVLGVAPAAVAGVSQTSETTGPWTRQATYAAWAVGGAARLSPEDLTLARSFRVKVPTVWVQS